VPAGSHVVVLGSDGGVWQRSRTNGGWAWTGHATPPAVAVRALAPPVVGPGDPDVRLCVWGDDGQVWVRSRTAVGWRWDVRGTPPGTTVFGFVTAVWAATPGGPDGLVAFVVTDDRTVWASWHDGNTSRWTTLGAPGAGLSISAGLGVAAVAGAPAARVVVVDATARRIGLATWPSGPAWVDVAFPPPGIAGRLGVLAAPDDPAATLVFARGTDGHPWQLRLTAADHAWTDWGAPPVTGSGRGRAVVAAIQDHTPLTRTFPAVPMAAADGRLLIAWPG
jgi:hypothetical protein